MPDRDLQGMQAHRLIVGGECLLLAEASIAAIERVTSNGMTEVPEVNSNLVRASGAGEGPDESRSVLKSLDHFELCRGGEPVGIDAASPTLARLTGDGRVAESAVPFGVAVDTGEIDLPHCLLLELGLHLPGDVPCLAQHDDAGRIGIQAMGGP